MAAQDDDRGRPGAASVAEGGTPAVGESRVVAVVKDLFFLARIRETARLVGVPITFAKTPEDAASALGAPTRLVLVDLTAGLDHERLFAVLAGQPAPVLAFTTHALARETQPWHDRCDRVVTKETLTRELPSLLREGLVRDPAPRAREDIDRNPADSFRDLP
jgi:hypothetical protein